MSMGFLLLVAVVVWLGIFAYIWMLDKKATSLEKRVAQLARQENQQ